MSKQKTMTFRKETEKLIQKISKKPCASFKVNLYIYNNIIKNVKKMKTPNKPTSTSVWSKSLDTAIKVTQVSISPVTRAYLVHTIDQYMTDASLCDLNPVGKEWLEMRAHHKLNTYELQKIGDKCLILSSILPERAMARNISPIFYCQIGQNAYQILSKQSEITFKQREIFTELSIKFLAIVRTLATIRHG